jgi:hypothetical protein
MVWENRNAGCCATRSIWHPEHVDTLSSRPDATLWRKALMDFRDRNIGYPLVDMEHAETIRHDHLDLRSMATLDTVEKVHTPLRHASTRPSTQDGRFERG